MVKVIDFLGQLNSSLTHPKVWLAHARVHLQKVRRTYPSRLSTIVSQKQETISLETQKDIRTII
jgi:hypothetical protein